MFFSKKLFVLIMTAGLLCAPFVLKAAEKKNNKNPQYEVQEYLEKKAAIVEPGVLPNSFWYWADIFGEEIKYLFTITKESKGDFLIETAAERLAELQALSEQGINKYADKLTTKHEKSISKAEDIFAKLKDEGWEKMQQKQEELEFEILKKEGKKTIFDNKTRVIEVPSKETKAVTLFFLFGVGSRYEDRSINGISHFIEHLMFKGTEKRPTTLDIAKELDSLGAEFNAMTSKDYTGYYIKIHHEKLKQD